MTALSLVWLAAASVWAVYLGRVCWAAYRLPRLDAAPPVAGARVSVVCAVHNEADLIEDTVSSLLRIGAPLHEVIVVDDRSTDGTGAALERFWDSRLRVLRVDSLPDGWLGKVHALQKGTEVATGELLLFIDAELDLHQDALRRAVGAVETRRLDHLAVLPRLRDKPFWLDVFLTTALVFYITSNRPWLSIERRPVSAVKGVGKFNLVRHAAWKRTEGFTWLRMEAAADDIALAQLIARHGGRSLLMAADDGVSLDWYRSVGEMVRRLEKNTVGAFARYRVPRALMVVLAAWVCALLPLGLLVPDALAQLAGGMAVLSTVVCSLIAHGPLRRRRRVLLALPLGMAFMGGVLLRSTAWFVRRRGIRWGSRTFDGAALRDGQRARVSP